MPARQALRGLFRPRNPTRAIIITLSASLAVLFCIFLVEQTLDASFVAAYPEGAPNVFFIDIQPDQVEDFADALGRGERILPRHSRDRSRQSMAAPPQSTDEESAHAGGDGRDFQFSLTYRDELLESESIVDGARSLIRPSMGAQVSVLDDVQEFAGVELGDVITFRIQGIPLDATVTSVRTRDRAKRCSLSSALSSPAPTWKMHPRPSSRHLTVDESEIPALQNRMVAQFPNVSVIDVTAAIDTFSDLARRVTRVIRFFTVLSISAGLLIVVSAVFATRFARIQEAAYYKVLGAKRRFVLHVFTAGESCYWVC